MGLVEGVSQDTMSSLLVKLGRLLAHEYAIIRGVRGDIQYINDEMASMQAFLGDLGAVPHGHHDRRIKDWMKQIRDVSYDVEDCVDDFAHRLPRDDAARGDVICCAIVVSWVYDAVTWWPRRDIASTVAALKARTQQIGERRIRYGVENPKSGDNSGGAAATTGFDAAENQQTSLQLVGAKKPVGVDEEMRELGKWVSIIPAEGEEKDKAAPSLSVTETQQSQTKRSDSDKILKEAAQHPSKIQSTKHSKQDPPNKDVLSIVGFGGVGKTTIARALYQSYGEQFDRRATVTVSQTSNIEAILRSILSQVMPRYEDDAPEQRGGAELVWDPIEEVWHHGFHGGGTSEITPADIQRMGKVDLAEELKKHLEKYSYLLLIDDVWSATTWKEIYELLPKSEIHCRLIVTTRFQAVATACKKEKGDRVHKVVTLSGDKPEKLFMEAMAESKASNDDEEDQKKVPPRLWEMCLGLPLAIVVMAGHAACNPHRSEDEWSKVCDALVPQSVKYLAQDGLTKILAHCYNDMNAETKTCALYLSMFPKGSVISRKRLTRRWIAEGLVTEKQGLSVEDVAEAYLNHLTRRKMIRPVAHSSNGKVKSYQVHDMVLEYIVSKASEENFVAVVGGHWLTAPPSSKVRRLSFQQQRGGDSVEGMNLSHVRSLTVFESMSHLHLRSNSFKFGIVQVLDLEGCMGFRQHYAKEICKMRLLKYLSLRRTIVWKLPKKIRNLQRLETLDVRETYVTELPNAVCQLKSLMNVLGGNKRARKGLKLPEDLKNTMMSLRVLSGIEIVAEGDNPVANFHHLTDLRKLAIYRLKIRKWHFEELSSSIEYLGGCSLHTLVIENDSSGFIESLGDLSSPPRFLTALELTGKLVKLPKWITDLDAITKLTLSVMALSSDALVQISRLKTLFSLTFSLAAPKMDPETASVVEENKAKSDGEIVVPACGFENLKFLRFSAPFVPLLRFSQYAMPKLGRLEVRFSILEGLYGVDNLRALKEVHLMIHDEAGEFTRSMVKDMATAAREGDGGPRVIVDQYHVSRLSQRLIEMSI